MWALCWTTARSNRLSSTFYIYIYIYIYIFSIFYPRFYEGLKIIVIVTHCGENRQFKISSKSVCRYAVRTCGAEIK